MKLIKAFLLVPLFIVTGYIQAQSVRTYTTVRLTGAPPVIDGKIIEEVWNEAGWTGDFIQKEPMEFEPPTEKTSFKILYDDDHLYVAVMAYCKDVSKIERRLGRRDSFEGDWVGMGFDSYNDDLTGFMFGVSAAGVKNDGIYTNDVDYDETWDPVWFVKVSIADSGWMAEMKIPLSQLRFSTRDAEMIWGLQSMRQLFYNDEFSVWQPIPNESSSWVALWGKLDGLVGLRPHKEVELLPYAMGGV